jgi:GNAT superfamily N-acetyltransferase
MPRVITTYLEMRSPDDLRPKRCADDRFWIGEATVAQWQFNRFLYVAVGSQWAWTDKLAWSDKEWRAYVESDRLRTFGAYYDGAPAGFYELHHDPDNRVEIAYLGLLPAFIGRGFGGALLTSALEVAWQMSPGRVWVHTCTLDHPAALANYHARGMSAYKVESPP